MCPWRVGFEPTWRNNLRNEMVPQPVCQVLAGMTG